MTQLATSPPPPFKLRFAAFLLALVFYTLLSTVVGVGPSTYVATHNNVLFGTDVPDRVVALSDPFASPRDPRTPLTHPAIYVVWGPIAALLSLPLLQFMSAASALFVAATAIPIAMMALGFTTMLSLSATLGASRRARIFVLAIYLLASIGVVGVVPDHWGISMGLLPSCFYLYTRRNDGMSPVILCGLLGIAAASTTLTNAALPILLGAAMLFERLRYWRLVLPIGAVGLTTLAPLVRPLSRLRHTRYITDYYGSPVHLGITGAAGAAWFAVVAPVIAPIPVIVTQPGATYEILSFNYAAFSHYGFPQLAAGIAWLAILLPTIVRVLADAATRSYASILLLWCVLNVAFHLAWGGELFVFSAHWMWALVAVLLLDTSISRHRSFMPLACLVIAGQLATLYRIAVMIDSFAL